MFDGVAAARPHDVSDDFATQARDDAAEQLLPQIAALNKRVAAKNVVLAVLLLLCGATDLSLALTDATRWAPLTLGALGLCTVLYAVVLGVVASARPQLQHEVFWSPLIVLLCWRRAAPPSAAQYNTLLYLTLNQNRAAIVVAGLSPVEVRTRLAVAMSQTWAALFLAHATRARC